MPNILQLFRSCGNSESSATGKYIKEGNLLKVLTGTQSENALLLEILLFERLTYLELLQAETISGSYVSRYDREYFEKWLDNAATSTALSQVMADFDRQISTEEYHLRLASRRSICVKTLQICKQYLEERLDLTNSDAEYFQTTSYLDACISKLEELCRVDAGIVQLERRSVKEASAGNESSASADTTDQYDAIVAPLLSDAQASNDHCAQGHSSITN